MRRHHIIIGLALSAMPLVAHGQQTPATAGDARLGGEAALSATLQEGLPAAPVREAIAAGRAKGASAARIDHAAAQAHGRLRTAAHVLARGPGGGGNRDAEIIAGAEALASGARPGHLERLRAAAAPGRSLAVSLRALADLSARGIDPAAASARLATRLRAGASDAEITDPARRLRAGAGGEAAASVGVAGTLRAPGAAAAVGSTLGASLGVGGLR